MRRTTNKAQKRLVMQQSFRLVFRRSWWGAFTNSLEKLALSTAQKKQTHAHKNRDKKGSRTAALARAVVGHGLLNRSVQCPARKVSVVCRAAPCTSNSLSVDSKIETQRPVSVFQNPISQPNLSLLVKTPLRLHFGFSKEGG